MARIGTGIQAGLGAIDYTPYLRGSVAGSEALGRGIAALGAGVGRGIERYQKTKQEEELEKQTNKVELASLDNNIKQATNPANKDLYADAPTVTSEQINDLKRRANSSNKAERTAAFAEISALNQEFKQAPARAIQRLQFTSAKNTLAEQEQERKNREAMSTAMGNVPTETTVVTRTPETRFGQPKADITPFLYGGGVAAPQAGSGVLMAAPRADGATAIPLTKTGKPAVENIPPPGVSDFLNQNRLKGQFEFISDSADAAIRQREADLERERAVAKNLEQTIKDATRPVPVSAMLGPGPVPSAQTRPSIPDSQRIALENQLFDSQRTIENKTNELNQVKQRISEAQKFSGQPLFKAAEDPFIAKGVSVLRAPMGQIVETIPSPDVFKKGVEKEIAIVERKENRPLTPDERLSILTKNYIKEGGQITPKIVDDFQKFVGADMEFGQVGDAKYVRIGNNVQFYDKAKELSASMAREVKQENYVQTLGVFANFIAKNGAEAFYQIPEKYRQALSSLHNRFGRDEYDQFGNKTGRKVPLFDAVKDEADSVYNRPPSTQAPKAMQIGRFPVVVQTTP